MAGDELDVGGRPLMKEVEFLDCGEIRMGSPYNVCRIRLNLSWQPPVPTSDFQDICATTSDGRYLALVRWDTSNNQPGLGLVP